jgi:UPF0042 nucleotide-binding protein
VSPGVAAATERSTPQQEASLSIRSRSSTCTCPDSRPVPPAADRVEDVRDRLRDPAAAHDIPDLKASTSASRTSS